MVDKYTLEARLSRCRERVEELEEVLRFYADERNHTEIEYGATAAKRDGGEKARGVLSTITEEVEDER